MIKKNQKTVSLIDFKKSNYYIDKIESNCAGGDIFTGLKLMQRYIGHTDGEDGVFNLVTLGQMFTELYYLNAGKRSFYEALSKNYFFVSATVGLSVISGAENKWDVAHYLAQKALDDCEKDSPFKEIYRKVLANSFRKTLNRMSDSALERRNKFSLTWDRDKPTEAIAIPDYIATGLQSEWRKKSVELYNAGDTNGAIFYAHKLNELFGTNVDALQFLHFYKKNDVKKTGKLDCDDRLFRLPTQISEYLTDIIFETLILPDKEFKKQFLTNKVFLSAITWVFERGFDKLSHIILDRFERRFFSIYRSFLKSRLVLNYHNNTDALYRIMLALVKHKPKDTLVYRVGDYIYDFTPIPFLMLKKNDLLADIPKHMSEAYYMFVTAFQFCRPLSEIQAFETAETVFKRMQALGFSKFKSTGAVAHVLIYAAFGIDFFDEKVFFTDLFQTTKKTVEKYLKLLKR